MQWINISEHLLFHIETRSVSTRAASISVVLLTILYLSRLVRGFPVCDQWTLTADKTHLHGLQRDFLIVTRAGQLLTLSFSSMVSERWGGCGCWRCAEPRDTLCWSTVRQIAPVGARGWRPAHSSSPSHTPCRSKDLLQGLVYGTVSPWQASFYARQEPLKCNLVQNRDLWV